MGGITPGWKGEVWLTDLGIRLPARQGTRLDAPENFRAETPISNAVVPVNFVAGLQVPVLTLPLLVTSNWFYPSLLETMLGVPFRSEPILGGIGGWFGEPRDFVSGDLASLGRVRVWNGAKAWQINNAKCAIFSLGLGFANLVQCSLTLWGTDIVGIGSYAQEMTPFVLLGARSQNCAHSLPVNPTQWQLVVRNPLRPNAWFLPYAPPGAARFFAPFELNSGTLKIEMALTVQAHHQWGGVADGVPFYVKVAPPGGAAVHLEITNPLFHERYAYTFGENRQKAPLVAEGRGNPSEASPLLIY